jgi:hypothetical protein
MWRPPRLKCARKCPALTRVAAFRLDCPGAPGACSGSAPEHGAPRATRRVPGYFVSGRFADFAYANSRVQVGKKADLGRFVPQSRVHEPSRFKTIFNQKSRKGARAVSLENEIGSTQSALARRQLVTRFGP